MTDKDPHPVQAEQIGKDVADAITRVRDLQMDINDMERTVRVLDEVSVLNEALMFASREISAFQASRDDINLRRKEIERLVRVAMPFDRTTYTTMATYEAFVIEEVSKSIKCTDMNGSELLTGVIESLQRDGVITPGGLPEVLQTTENDCEVEGKRDTRDVSDVGAPSTMK